jgi:hypothetical protein
MMAALYQLKIHGDNALVLLSHSILPLMHSALV